jgi:hypothetical protein
MPIRTLIIVGSIAVMAACTRGGMSSALSPVGPSSATTLDGVDAASGAAPTFQGRQDVLVTMHDACDPDTFNAAIGPGSCTRAGGVPFDQFIADLTRLGFAAAWHFAPPAANVRVGQRFVAENTGGEVHTFTEVAAFGGGIVPQLNDLAHTPEVAPECGALAADDFVPPGGTYQELIDHTGTVKIQCCIHPWMRLVATVIQK